MTALCVANAHASNSRANGHRTPSSYRSAPSAPDTGPDTGPGRTHFHFQCTHLSPFLSLSVCCFVLLTRYWGIVTVTRCPRVKRPQMLTWGVCMFCFVLCLNTGESMYGPGVSSRASQGVTHPRFFFDGYCSTVQGLLDWFDVDLGFTELSFIQIDLCVLCVFVLYSRVSLSSCPFWTFCTASPARWECF